MAEIIYINDNLCIDYYRFVIIPVYHQSNKLYDDKPEIKELCMIGIKDNRTNRIVVHPFTEFVFKWKYKSYNSMRQAASTVTRFLNYIYNNNNEFKLRTFSELKSIHGTKYLNSLSNKSLTLSYINDEERVLNQFYFYLYKKDLLYNTLDINEQLCKEHDRSKYKSLFKDVSKPSAGPKNHLLHNIEPDLQIFFLETAMIYEPRIALGVYFELFGGLRVSEVVNITTTSISIQGPYGRYGMKILLKNRELRTDLKNRNSSHVKKPRQQVIKSYKDYLPILYKVHLENYTTNDNSHALFANTNGKAMTSKVYRDYFTKVKKKFILDLESSGDNKLVQSAIFLKGKKWSTHFLRGAFSNNIAEISQDITTIMLERGDSNPNSARVYLDSTPTKMQMRAKALEDMYSNYLSNK